MIDPHSERTRRTYDTHFAAEKPLLHGTPDPVLETRVVVSGPDSQAAKRLRRVRGSGPGGYVDDGRAGAIRPQHAPDRITGSAYRVPQ
jgi:hypothetical protein